MAMQSLTPRRDLRNIDTTDAYEPVTRYGEIDPGVVCAGICLTLIGLGLAT